MISIPHLGLTGNATHGSLDNEPQTGFAPAGAPVPSDPAQPNQSWKPRLPVGLQTPVIIQSAKSLSSNANDSTDLAADQLVSSSTETVPKTVTEKSGTSAKKLTPAEQQNQLAIHQLRDAILQRFPLASPAIILFVGSENNIHTDFASARIAASLADMAIGNILLVDSCPNKRLTRAYGAVDHRGVSNLMAATERWESLTLSLPAGGLDFLPAGTSHWEHWGAGTRLIEMASAWKRQYQFILVTAGDAHHPLAKLWTSVCDGSYLMVSMKNSNPEIAESAVTELQTSGARLLGCIATDYSQPEMP